MENIMKRPIYIYIYVHTYIHIFMYYFKVVRYNIFKSLLEIIFTIYVSAEISPFLWVFN